MSDGDHESLISALYTSQLSGAVVRDGWGVCETDIGRRLCQVCGARQIRTLLRHRVKIRLRRWRSGGGGRDPCGASILSVAPPVAETRPLWLGPWVNCLELVRWWDVRYQVPACCELGVSGQSAWQKLGFWVLVSSHLSRSPEHECWSHLAPACRPLGTPAGTVRGESGCW